MKSSLFILLACLVSGAFQAPIVPSSFDIENLATLHNTSDFGSLTQVNARNNRRFPSDDRRREETFYDPISEAILKSLPTKAQDILRYGLPGMGQLLLKGDDIVIGYDTRMSIPIWVMEHLTPDNLVNRGESRKNHDFHEDESVHPYFRSTLSDYKRSGYDRGHMAAAGNHKKSFEDLDDTFALSNIAPQVGKDFNQGIWNDLEMYIRDRLVKKHKETFIITGSLFLPKRDLSSGKMRTTYEVIGKNFVAVPTHFFKVVVAVTEDGPVMESYVMPNVPLRPPIHKYLVPKSDVEKMSGLLIFDKIPMEEFVCVNRKCQGIYEY